MYPIPGTQDVVVTISGINFQDVVSEFETCLQGMKQFNFADYRYTKINYNKKAESFNKRAKLALDRLVEYLNTEPEVKSINIVAHTDSRGFKRVNLELAGKFANMVKDYFESRGVKVKITAKAAGEGQYVGDNRTAKGRAANQRIIISLNR